LLVFSSNTSDMRGMNIKLNRTLYRVIKKSMHLMITVQKTYKNILNVFNHLPR
jgi:hypothetical protein